MRRTLRNLSAALQLGFGVDRTRRRPDGFVFQKGAQWFSITHALAQYLLEKRARSVSFLRYLLSGRNVRPDGDRKLPFRDTLPEHAFENDYASCLSGTSTGSAAIPHSRTATSMSFSPHRKRRSSRKFDYRTSPGVVDALFDRFDNFLSGARKHPCAVFCSCRWAAYMVFCIYMVYMPIRAYTVCAKPQSVRSFRERE